MNKEIERDLFALADEKYKNFHSNLCPGTNNIIGVRVPVLRKYAKELVEKNNAKEYLKIAKSDYYEEIMLQGMVIGLLKLEWEETKENIQKFIPKIDNWAVCDVFCAGLKITKKYKKEMWDLIQSYLESNQEFELRFSIVMLLDFYIDELYIDEVLKILPKVKHQGYYVKMAVAWAISIAFIKYPEKTINVLKNVKLDKFTYNKALQKILESYRVDEETKKEIRLMKK